MSRVKAGFTLIELLIVVVIIGILAAIAVPKFAESKARAYVAAQRSELRNLSTQQEAYFFDRNTYAADAVAAGHNSGSGVTVTVNEASTTGWSATTAHASTTMHCAIFYGTAAPVAPAVAQGVIKCE